MSIPVYTLDELRSIESPTREVEPGTWVLARPCDGPWFGRFRAAIKVLTGEADAFTWPGIQRDAL
jgi:hypothetical protein